MLEKVPKKRGLVILDSSSLRIQDTFVLVVIVDTSYVKCFCGQRCQEKKTRLVVKIMKRCLNLFLHQMTIPTFDWLCHFNFTFQIFAIRTMRVHSNRNFYLFSQPLIFFSRNLKFIDDNLFTFFQNWCSLNFKKWIMNMNKWVKNVWWKKKMINFRWTTLRCWWKIYLFSW